MLAPHHRILTLRAAAAALAVIALAACDGTTHPSSASNGEAVVARGIDPNRQAPAAPIRGATRGGTVTVLATLDALTFDPTEAYYIPTVSILSGLVTRSLTQYVYDPEQKTMVLVPDIATDVGTPNDDYTEWTYTIRPGVKFEDGSKVTAQDVAYGIERSFDRHDFPGGAAYSNDYFLHGDTYRGPYRSGTLYDGIEVHGDTLTLKMARPFPDMPYWAAYPAIGPIPQTGSSPASYAMHPMATGPYKFAHYVPGKSLTLVRNDEWNPATDPGRHQYPDRYRFDFTQQQKQIDATILGDTGRAQTTVSWQTPQTADLHSALADASDQVTVGTNSCVYVLGLDYRRITDLKVRQAVGYAYPYDDMVVAKGLLDGVTSTPGRTILPPGTSGYVDYNSLSTEPGETDPDKARALLKEAGYQPGEYTLSFAYAADDPASVAQKDALVAGFEAGGFSVKPFRAPNQDASGAAAFDPRAPVNTRSIGWCSDWPSASQSLLSQLASRSDNFAYFSESAVDDQIDRIEQLLLADQPAAWGALDQQIETDYYPYVITNYGGVAMLHGSKIGGMNDDNDLGMPTWKDISIVR